MRAALLPWWPALSRTYGVRPIDVGRYSAAELRQYVWDLEDEAEQTRRASRG